MSALEIIGGICSGLAINEFCDLSPWAADKIVRWSAYLRYPDKARAEIRSEELAALIDERPGKLFKLITALCFAAAATRVWIARTCTRNLRDLALGIEPTAAGTLQLTTTALLTVTLMSAVALRAVESVTPPRQLSPTVSAPGGATNMVILADESGSMTPAALEGEIQDIEKLVDSRLSLRAWVTVIGFGGANGAVPLQVPDSVVCRPTSISDSAGRAYLSECARGLHVRSEAEGNNTDYAAAFAQAMAYFTPGSPAGPSLLPGATKAIVLMTGGGLWVARDPAYPQPDWMPAAIQATEQQLVAAKADGVRVWTCQDPGSVSATPGALGKALMAPNLGDCPADGLNGLLRDI